MLLISKINFALYGLITLVKNSYNSVLAKLASNVGGNHSENPKVVLGQTTFPALEIWGTPSIPIKVN